MNMRRTCESCGKPIPAGRLAALPETTTCIWCSKVVRPRTEADVDVDDGHDGDDLVRSGQSMVYRDRR